MVEEGNEKAGRGPSDQKEGKTTAQGEATPHCERRASREAARPEEDAVFLQLTLPTLLMPLLHGRKVGLDRLLNCPTWQSV